MNRSSTKPGFLGVYLNFMAGTPSLTIINRAGIQPSGNGEIVPWGWASDGRWMVGESVTTVTTFANFGDFDAGLLLIFCRGFSS